MATPRWESGAAKVAQVQTYAFAGTWETDDLIRVTVGKKIKDLTAGSTTTATVVSNTDTNIDALSSSTYPEITATPTGFTASSATTTLTLTAKTAGVPFTCTLTPLEANGGAADAQTIEGAGTATTGTAATANAGPNVWSTPANWSAGAVPAAGDTVYIDNSSADIFYGLSNAGATITATHITQSYTGLVGLPKTNTAGTAYPEYRTDYLTLDCTTWHIGAGPGQGSGRIKVNSGTVQTTVNVYNTGTPKEFDLEAMLWKGTHASNVMNVRGSASVGVAVFGGETATIATLSVDENARVRCGAGTTLTTVNVNSGTVELNSNITTLNVYGGTVTVNGTATVGQLNVYGGLVVYNSTGTIGGNTLVGESGRIDFSTGLGAVTVTNPVDSYALDPVYDPDKRVASLVIDYNGRSPLRSLGTNYRLTRAATA